MTSLLNNVLSLINKGIGDLSRLEHIKESIQNNKQLYNSDRIYVDNLIKNHLIPNEQKSNENISTYQENEESKDVSTKNIPENKLKSQDSFCVKCGVNLESTGNFCTKCGAPQEKQSESFCEKCRNKIYGNNPCTNCNPTSNRSIQDKSNTSSTSGMPERILEMSFPVSLLSPVGGIDQVIIGIIAWFSLRNRNPKKARYLLKIGIVYALALGLCPIVAVMIINQFFLR